MFLNDISTIDDENIFFQGIWNYIINNNNYPNDIICNREFLMKQSSCCSLFNIFKKSNVFCIKYKKIIHCDICNNNLENNNELSSPIFSVDDEDLQLGNINSIYKYRYSSYTSGCSNCIKNDIYSNTFVLISNIVFPNILVVALEFKDFNPNLELS